MSGGARLAEPARRMFRSGPAPAGCDPPSLRSCNTNAGQVRKFAHPSATFPTGSVKRLRQLPRRLGSVTRSPFGRERTGGF